MIYFMYSVLKNDLECFQANEIGGTMILDQTLQILQQMEVDSLPKVSHDGKMMRTMPISCLCSRAGRHHNPGSNPKRLWQT